MRKLSLLSAVAISAMLLASQSSRAHDMAAGSSDFRPYVSIFAGAALIPQDITTKYSGFSSGSDVFRANMGYVLGGVIGAQVPCQRCV